MHRVFDGITFVDPAFLREDVFTRFLNLAETAGIRVVYYCQPSPLVFQRIVQTSARFPVDVIFLGSMQESEEVSRLILRRNGCVAASYLLHLLGARIRGLPVGLGEGVARLLLSVSGARGGFPPHDVLTRRGRRDLSRAGLKPPRILRRAARAAHALEQLRISEKSVQSVAEYVGFSGSRALEVAFHSLVAMTPRRASIALSSADFAATVAEHLVVLIP